MSKNKIIAFSVWVGDGEVNENYIDDIKEAISIAECWRDKGYDDVYVEKVKIDPETENDDAEHVDWVWPES